MYAPVSVPLAGKEMQVFDSGFVAVVFVVGY